MKNTLLCVLTLACISHMQAQPVARYDVLIHEIMANPSSSPGLPGVKYIELFNASPKACDLNGWQIANGKSTAVIKAHFILQPDSFVVLCSTSAVATLSPFGATIGVTGFPSPAVNGDVVLLRSASDRLIHAVAFNKSWYANELKSNGGWSLEMVDAKNPCNGGSNWKACADPKGGTPAAPNSIAGDNRDVTMPQLVRAYASDSLQILLVFDETLDSLQASVKENYTCSDGIGIKMAEPLAPLFNTVRLTLNTQLLKDKIYSLHVKNIVDCSGNTSGGESTASVGLAHMPAGFDIVINEILFNPPADGADYIELYNRSNHIINVKTLYIANRSSAGNINGTQQLSREDILIFPGSFVVVTDNVAAVKQQYMVKHPEALLEIINMPSYPNAAGTVVLLNAVGEVLDEFHYDENWHFGLVTSYKGVALERIDYDQPTQEKSNWHSAAASVGYGTPTYQNSQFRANDQLRGEISISPGVFSPDNDGYDDFLTIAYQFPEPGYVCNITVFDARGRTVRHLVRNGLCGTKGYFRWDGLDEKNQQTGMGIYIILTEVYNLKGKTKKYKQAATLARKR